MLKLKRDLNAFNVTYSSWENLPATKENGSLPSKLENKQKIIPGGLWAPPCPSLCAPGRPWWWWCTQLSWKKAYRESGQGQKFPGSGWSLPEKCLAVRLCSLQSRRAPPCQRQILVRKYARIIGFNLYEQSKLFSERNLQHMLLAWVAIWHEFEINCDDARMFTERDCLHFETQKK